MADKKCIVLCDFNINFLGLNSVIACQDFSDKFIGDNFAGESPITSRLVLPVTL